QLHQSPDRFSRFGPTNFASLPLFHDVRGAKPETFCRGMVIGLLASLEPYYEVRSNRESGNGRPDY
ncbi:MAG TPA: hypothetical protein PK156_44405, partial [Polyangium sp.]|nr:hypothetical protein [Polyangium sp.]